MRTATLMTMTIILAVGMLVIAGSVKAQTSIIHDQDIQKLMATAEATFDMTKEDAVLLFDCEEYHWLPDKRLKKIVHRIVWINTDNAVDRYGDNRIPFDEKECTLDVITVRTWRDGQWWETGPTGIVETLPYRVRDAYDYTNVREMMLLHNGIEIPCILEVAYTIEDKTPFRKGAEGLWSFARREPAVVSRFTLGIPANKELNVFVSEGIAEPKEQTRKNPDMNIYTWQAGPLEAIDRPFTDDVAAYTPHITWSVWNSWMALGGYVANALTYGIELDETLKKKLDSLKESARTVGELADNIAGFIKNTTTHINYPYSYWWTSPRSASKTYASAYGHRLDRAILAAAMFKEAGISVQPAFLGNGYGSIDEGVPSLARLQGVGLWLTGENLDAYYDPGQCTVSNGIFIHYNRSIWFPVTDEKPEVRLDGKDKKNQFDIRFELSYDKEKESFTGKGFLSVNEAFNRYDNMIGLNDETEKYLNSLVSGILKDAKVTKFNPTLFNRREVVFGFTLELKCPEKDDYGRIPLKIGVPSGGISERLPIDVRLYHQKRFSPIAFPGLMSQQVELKLKTEGIEIVLKPENRQIENQAGNFDITVSEKDDYIVINRKLSLIKTKYGPEDWPVLRELLLADHHERNQDILLKLKKDESEDKKKK